MSTQEMNESGGSYVYFFLHSSEPLVKIGKADNWATRAPQVGGSDLIDFDNSYVKRVGSTQDAYDLEFMLHSMFSSRRLPLSCGREGHTEWFCASAMEEVHKLVRGLQKTNGDLVKPGKAQPKRWEGERIDIAGSSDEELASVIVRHCSVRTDGENIYIHPLSDGFELVLHDLVGALHVSLGASYSTLPAFRDFPDTPWIMMFAPGNLARAAAAFNIQQ